jgi:hypothetical protein
VTTADGTVLGVTKVVNNGPDTDRWNLVILGDGYRTSELQTYHANVNAFVSYFRTVEPFKGMWGKINIHRVDVTSTDSGGDNPLTCGDGSLPHPSSGVVSDTYFDSTFCKDGNTRRLLAGDNATAWSVAISKVPDAKVALVMVNSPLEYGGGGNGAFSGGSVAWFSTCPGYSTNDPPAAVAIHEIAHSYFFLADEYGSGVPWPLGPGHPPNITDDTNILTTDWRDLILPSTLPLPTMTNPSFTSDNTNNSPVADRTVGLFEGAGGMFRGIYRSEYDCAMRTTGKPFCKVCRRQIRARLAQFGGRMSWDIDGNIGTNPVIDYIGTADNQPLIIKTNATEKLRITSNGDVSLKSSRGTTPGGALTFQNYSGVMQGKIWSTNSPVAGLNLSTGGKASGIIINEKGNVGIGTDNPGARLEVNNGDLFIKAAGNRNAGDIVFLNSANVQKARIWSEPLTGTGLHLSSGDRIPDFSIHANGNVGIGTATPGAKLEIKDGDLLLKAAAEDAGDIVFQNATGAPKGRIWSEPMAGSGLNLSSGDLTPDITINSAGNVGIGTQQPNYKLEVRSTILGQPVMVATNLAAGPAMLAENTAAQLPAIAALNYGSGPALGGQAMSTTTTSFGVVGLAGPNTMIPVASLPGGIGVVGGAPEGTGVAGFTMGGTSCNGVEGYHNSATNPGAGIHGLTECSNGVAVYGKNNTGTGDAGRFFGNVRVQGTIYATGKAFRIDHPLAPAEKFLNHSSVESPDMMTVYSGNAKTDDSCEVIVELPDYFEALNHDFKYQLTVIGELALVAVTREIKGNCFAIQSDRPNVKVSWQVTGIRNDAYAKAHRIPVEEKKSDSQQGRYLHPELYAVRTDRPDAKLPIGSLVSRLGSFDSGSPMPNPKN